MADDNLKEVLGFDPETGERDEDRSSLRPIAHKEIQEKFVNWFNKIISERGKEFTPKKEIMIPEKLLEVLDISNFTAPMPFEIARRYYAYVGEPKNEKDRPENPFLNTSSIEFGTPGHPDSIKIIKYGEHGGETIEDAQILELTPRFNSVRVTLRSKESNVSFDYSNYSGGLGEIRYIYIAKRGAPQKTLSVFRLGSEGTRWSSDRGEEKIIGVDDLLNGEQIRLESEGSNFSARLGEGKNNVVVERFVDNVVKDRFLLPRYVSAEGIRGKLLDPVTLKDPVNAPSELDDSWRYADLLETVGIKWERY